MSPNAFEQIVARYPQLRIAVVGDFCLDRYLEIDPGRNESSIETGLDVYNVTRIRSQPGAAGTILNNLVALGIGTIYPVGFCGDDGEGYELRRVLASLTGVRLNHFQTTSERHTFTYCKPLMVEQGKTPRELNRFDTKNWTPTPEHFSLAIAASVRELAQNVDAIIVMDQVDIADTGVVTDTVRRAIADVQASYPKLFIIADCRRGLAGYPPVTWKTNRAELAKLDYLKHDREPDRVMELSLRHNREVYLTRSELGIATAFDGQYIEVPALPVRGEIDIVGAGDAVTANITAARAAEAGLKETLIIANTAASIVIHQLGTTGTANVAQIRELMHESGHCA